MNEENSKRNDPGDDELRKLSPLQRALLAVKEMRAKLDSIEAAKSEPIAVVGIGCRFPGSASGPRAYWELLRDGVDAVTEIPKERWDIGPYYDPNPDVPGKMNTRWGGFLSGVDQFDAPFFNISALEAAAMDPQQRLLLEVAHEALDDAGQPAHSLAGSLTGVFVGLSLCEYSWLSSRNRYGASCYTATGCFNAVAANRLSYILDLRGPSYTVDAVCSASLLAVHVACQSLRSGDCTLALAAGSGLLLRPEGFVWFTKLGALAADGRCKAFDHRANGIVLGEGVAVVVLKTLKKALADGDPIYALISGSAVAQDGKSNGLTAPTRHAQEAMLRAAYKQANVDPSRVHYIEAHGTGTVLGDPIEAQALGAVLGSGRPADRPCYLGSVKTNLGHLQMVGGVAGLIKVVLAMKHRQLPASLHFEAPNPHIDFEGLGLRMALNHGPWPYDEPAIAGVTSLSFGGTNVHVVLEEFVPALAEPSPPLRPAGERALILPISAQSAGSLDALASAYRRLLDDAGAPCALGDICYTAGARRAHYAHRLALAFQSREELVGQLDAIAKNELPSGACAGKRPINLGPRKVVFVFSGQGSQWARMGAGLFEGEPVFRSALSRCDEALREHLDFSIVEELAAPEATSRLDELDVIQPAIFAVQVGIAELWRSWGIEPAAVVGHSMGEVAAAHIAGALSLRDAARVICKRSQLIKRTSGQGAMALAAISADEAEELIARGYRERLSVAAENGPRSVVLSGDAAALAEVLDALKQKNVFCGLVRSDAAGHCALMDPLRGELAETLRSIEPREGSVAIVSTVTGELISGAELGAAYWVRNMREPVRFSTAMRALVEGGHSIFLEISPHPLLLPSVEQCAVAAGVSPLLLHSFKRLKDERASMLSAVGALYAAGHTIDFRRVLTLGRVVPLPMYPWERQRYWISDGAEEDLPTAAAEASSPEARPAPQRKSELVRRLEQRHPKERRALIVAHLQGEVMKILGLEPSMAPSPDRGFFEIGMTSLQVMELKTHIEASFGRTFPSTLAFDCPTIDALASYLIDALSLRSGGDDAPSAEAPREPRRDTEVRAGAEVVEAELLRLSEGELGDLLEQELLAINEMVL